MTALTRLLKGGSTGAKITNWMLYLILLVVWMVYLMPLYAGVQFASSAAITDWPDMWLIVAVLLFLALFIIPVSLALPFLPLYYRIDIHRSLWFVILVAQVLVLTQVVTLHGYAIGMVLGFILLAAILTLGGTAGEHNFFTHASRRVLFPYVAWTVVSILLLYGAHAFLGSVSETLTLYTQMILLLLILLYLNKKTEDLKKGGRINTPLEETDPSSSSAGSASQKPNTEVFKSPEIPRLSRNKNHDTDSRR